MSQPPTRTSLPQAKSTGSLPIFPVLLLYQMVSIFATDATVTTCRLWLLPRDLHHLRGRLGVKMLRKWKVIVATRDHAIMQYGYIIYMLYLYIISIYISKIRNAGQLRPPTPANFKVFNFFQGLGWVDKTNQTPQDQMSCALAWTLRFGERGGMSFFF